MFHNVHNRTVVYIDILWVHAELFVLIVRCANQKGFGNHIAGATQAEGILMQVHTLFIIK